jgi:hypothetical protein
LAISQNSKSDAVALILELLRARLSTNPPAPRASLAGNFNEALELAANHQVGPALYGGLRRTVKDSSIWLDLAPFVQMIEAENIQRNRMLHEEAIRVAALLNAKEIKSVFLKGGAVVLASTNFAPWRHVTDLDLLVNSYDASRAMSTLLQCGYHQQADHAGFDEGIHHHYPALYNPNSNAFIEFHVRLMQAEEENPFGMPEILKQAVRIERDGHKLLIPCPEHRMIHLIAHAQISNWGYVLRQIVLKDIVDAVELDSLQDINWSVVRKAFVDIRAEDKLMGFLWAAHRILQLRLPYFCSDCRRAEGWADEAVRAIYVRPSRWQTLTRVVTHYLTLFARNPTRLRIVWKTLRDPRRLRHLLSVNHGRL